MSARDTGVLLEDMLDCVVTIRQYTQGLTEASLRTNRMAQDAIVRRLEILGEAANQLPAAYRAQHPEIPWGMITPP
ncbi:MAG TPA: HepT-like ribonuclease domain-containing protein [Ktedonobacterales bacterium]|nr:HepT-like ribonuclease domain-containing protein [Ktedonobacterales bacterium]